MKHVAEFLNDVSTNETLGRELGECVAKADTSHGKVKLALRFARDAGYDVTEEELAVMVEKANVKAVLSDDELDSVAGGFGSYNPLIDLNVAQIATGTGNGTGTGMGIDITTGMGIDESGWYPINLVIVDKQNEIFVGW
jgi:predicted ribosomally synthesized peptide with nif11-like leader